MPFADGSMAARGIAGPSDRARRTLLIDDHGLFRAGMRRLLEDSGEYVVGGEASTVAEGRARALGEDWDVVILDLGLPDGSALELLKVCHDQKPGMPVLVVTMFSERQYGLRVLKAGAAGFLRKDSAGQELMAALRAIAAGKLYLGERLATMAATVGLRGAAQPDAELSDREYEVVRAIARGQSTTAIASGLGVSPKTVSTYRARALLKLNLRSSADLVRYVLEQDVK